MKERKKEKKTEEFIKKGKAKERQLKNTRTKEGWKKTKRQRRLNDNKMIEKVKRSKDMELN